MGQPVVHFEILGKDAQKLQSFYRELFSWDVGEPAGLGAVSVLLYLRGIARPRRGEPRTTYRVELDRRMWTVRTASGRVHVECGEPGSADAALTTTPATLNGLLADPSTLDAVLAAGGVAVDGDLGAVRRLLDSAAY